MLYYNCTVIRLMFRCLFICYFFVFFVADRIKRVLRLSELSERRSQAQTEVQRKHDDAVERLTHSHHKVVSDLEARVRDLDKANKVGK